MTSKLNLIKLWKAALVVFVLCIFIKKALCPLILGTLFLYTGVFSLLSTKRIKRIGINCTGTIVDCKSDDEGHNTVVIEFTTIDGEVIREVPYIYSSSDISEIGLHSEVVGYTVPILYHPNNPKEFILMNKGAINYFEPALFILAAILSMGLSFGMLLGYIN